MADATPSPLPVGFGLYDLSTHPAAIVRAMKFQHNPHLLHRTLAPAPDGNGATELIEFALDLDWAGGVSADEPYEPGGIQPQLATIESIAFPTPAVASAPLTLLVWGEARWLPVRVTELVVTEEAFDYYLYPVRATVEMTMEVIAAPPRSPAGAEDATKAEHRIARRARAGRERLAKRASVPLDALGVDLSRI